MEESAIRELLKGKSMERFKSRNVPPVRGDWKKFCEGIEQCCPALPTERLVPKKLRRFKERLLEVKLNKRGGNVVVRSSVAGSSSNTPSRTPPRQNSEGRDHRQ
jgi:hypothetical protein